MKSKNFLITAIILIFVTAALTPSITKADVFVYDNNDQNLGILMNHWGGTIDLFIPSLGGIFRHYLDAAQACNDELMSVYFQSGDCSGTPYSVDPLPVIFDFSPTPIAGFYKVDYNGKQTFTPGSQYLGCVCQPGPGELAEYYPFVQVQMPFTTPFALPLKFKVRTKTIVVPLSE